MAERPDPTPPDDLLTDPLLRAAPVVEGFKVLEPAVLYARIGDGGMGMVYRGRHYKLDLDVAVKCLKPARIDEDPDFVRRFEREARLAASIAHQNVVRVMDVQEKNGLHYLVMEFVRGETSTQRVLRKGRLAERELLTILYGATAGLAEAHQRGIVHRDIKPDNILISLEGRVKLADLGLAKSTGAVDGRSVSMPASQIMGTPQYMPPEQWETTDVTAAADIWALGATFYFLCTGHAGISGAGTYHAVAKRIREHDYPTLRAERPDLRPDVHALFERCVARDPKDRFADARVLLRELKKLAVDDDEQVLLDPDSGSGNVRVGTVTPPPRQTLLRIRAQVETATSAKTNEAEKASAPPAGVAARSEGPTVPVSRRAASARTFWFAAAALLLLVVLGGGYAAGWFSPDPGKPNGRDGAKVDGDPSSPGQPADKPQQPPPSAPKSPEEARAAARQALERAQKLLPQVGQLDAAIAEFERALQFDASLAAEANPLLSGALSEKAEGLAAAKPDEAFALCVRAVGLQPENSVARRRHEQLRELLTMRLAAGIALGEPKVDAVLTSRQCVLRGTVTSPNFKTLRYARVDGALVPADFPKQSRPVLVVAGKFTLDETLPQDGAFLLWLQGEDGNGVVATLPPVRVVVDTVDPVLRVEAPQESARVASTVEVRGTVVDTTACTVTVDGFEASVAADGSFAASVGLVAGPQTVRIEARDAAGRRASLQRAVLVDASGPDVKLGPLPQVTKDATVQVTGTVEDLQGGELRIAGTVVKVAADGTFAVPFPLPKDGKYEVLVEARDDLGNDSGMGHSIRRDTTPPVVEWTAPTAAKVPPGEIEVSGTVNDASAVIVTVNGKPAVVRGTTWQAKVDVAAPAAGSKLVPVTRVTVVATDEVGNESKPLLQLLTPQPVVADRIETGIGLTMVRIEAATFRMGSPANEAGRSDDETQHTVTISKPYWISETEVTQKQWRAVMNTEPWKGKSNVVVGDDFAASYVSWHDAVQFCEQLTEMERDAGRLNDKCRYALPTEAQWELAVRGSKDNTSRFCFGEDQSLLSQYAVYGRERKVGYAESVRGNRRANAFGLFDMHGNVWEWCADCADSPGVITDSYRDGVTDPVCLRGSQRVNRGGGWFIGPGGCRSAFRNCNDPRLQDPDLGFRPALVERSAGK